jgi:TRAP-type mannitol/chloroaromatic compound transport system permease small subunit
MNWTAVVVGTIAAFGLGMIWFSPKIFGKGWAEGSHNIQSPASPPFMAMVILFVGIALLALVVGITETNQAIMTAIGAILAVALTVAGMDLFSQKSGKATMIDAGYVVASGVVMIAAQGLL